MRITMYIDVWCKTKKIIKIILSLFFTQGTKDVPNVEIIP